MLRKIKSQDRRSTDQSQLMKQNFGLERTTTKRSKDPCPALTDLSVECYQEVDHECNLNALTGYSSWTDRNGQVNHYWHGNASTESSD